MSGEPDPVDAVNDAISTGAAINMRNVANDNPDAAARAQRLGAMLGLPPDTVQRNMPTVNQRVAGIAAQETARSAPDTAAWLASDPGNAAVVAPHELGGLANIESLVKRTWADVGGGISGGMKTAIQGVGSMVDAADYKLQTPDEREAEAALGRGPTFSQTVAPVAAPFVQAQAAYQKQAPNPNLAERLISTGASMIPLIAAPELAPAYFAAQGAQQASDDAAAKGATEGDTSSAVLGDATVQGVLGALPVAHYAEAALPEIGNAALNAAAKLGVGTAASAAHGAAMQVGGNAVEQATIDPNKPLLDGAGDTAAQMAILHALIHAPGAVSDMNGRSRAAEAAVQGADTLNQAADAIKADPVAARAPDRFTALLKAMAPDANVYVPAEAAQRYMQASADGYSDFQRAGVADQLPSALASGSDIVIPAADYLAHIAPTDAHDALKDDIRLSPDGMSVNEAKDFSDHYDDYLQARGADLAAQTKADYDAMAPQQQVYSEILSQMRGAGRTLDASKQIASLVAAHMQTFGEMNGRDAMAEYQAMPLDIRQELPDQLSDRIDNLDHVIDTLKASKKAPSQGKSLLQFMSDNGGVRDDGGELKAMDADKWHVGKAFRGRLVRDDGLSPEAMAEKAQDAGYLHQIDPDQMSAFDQRATPADLHEAVGKELTGKPVYARALDPKAAGVHEAAGQLDELLGRLGVDPEKASNAEIKKAVTDYAAHPEKAFEQPVYHGSPHIFDRFDSSAIGTGEGAQVYGHGLYFASRKGIAEHYRNALTRSKLEARWNGKSFSDLQKDEEPNWDALEGLAIVEDLSAVGNKHPIQQAAGLAFSRKRPTVGKWLEDHQSEITTQPKGRLYHVEIPEDHEYLNWDKPLSEQSPGVRSAVEKEMTRHGLAPAEPGGADSLTGRQIYKLIGSAAYDHDAMPGRPDVQASRTLHDAGIAGIRYLDGGSRADGEGSHNYVLFDDSRAKITHYEQPARGDISFPSGRAVIRLFKGADPSTPIHELGHFFLEKLQRAAEHPEAGDDVKGLWQTAQKWLGHDGGDLTVEQHEQFARGFEAYAMEGKAPSDALRTVFRKFAQWLGRIYRTVRALDVNLSPEIRDVFDRLLASQDEIKSARERAALNPIFASAEDAGMTQAEYAAYTKAIAASNSDSEDKLLTKLTENTRKARTKEWKEERETMRPSVQAEIDARPDVRAYHFLTKGELLGSEDQPGRMPLNKGDVVNTYGTDTALDRLPKSVPPVYSAEGGVHPDLIAEMTGHPSGEAMMNSVMDLEQQRRDMRERGDKRQLRRAMVEDELNARMIENHGDALHDGSIEEEALDALHGDARMQQVSMEVRALGKKADNGEPQWTAAAMERFAQDTVMASKVSELYPDRYARAERQNGKEAQRALLAGKTVEALVAKRQQLLNMHLFRAAREAKADADSQTKRLMRVGMRDKLASTDQDYLNQAHGLIDRFGFPTPKNVQQRDNLADWLQERASAYDSIVVPDWLKGEEVKKANGDLTVSDLSDINDAVQSILHAGREAKNVTVEGKRTDLASWVSRVREKAQAIKDLKASNDLKSKTGNVRAGAYAFMKIETLADHLDDGDSNGPMNNLFIKRASDANLEKIALSKEIMGKVIDARNEVPADIRRSWLDKITAPELVNQETGKPYELTRYDLLQVALNTGSESNFNKMVEGMGWTHEDVEAVLKRYLRPEEGRFIGKLWDAVGSLWPKIAETEKNLSGLVPEKVEPRAVTLGGVDHPGGYWPLVRDPVRGWVDKRGGEDDLEKMFNSSFSGVSTPKGHTISRNQAAYPISFDLDHVLGKHLNDTITRVAYGPWVADAMRTLNDKGFKAILKDKVGQEAHALMVDWLRRQVGYRLVNPRDIAIATKFLRAARINAMTVQTGFSLVVGAEHAAAYAQTIGKIGGARTAQGVARYLANPMLNAKYVLDRSPEMKASIDAQDRELRDQMDDLNSASLREPTALKVAATPFRVAQAMSHAFISMISQYTVRIPTWLGAESKALSEGMSNEDAARYADKVVRTTHGTGWEKDLPKIQSLGHDTGAEAAKLLTMYRGYHLTQMNQLIEAGYKVSRGDKAAGMQQGFWVAIAAPILSATLLGGLRGGLPQKTQDWASFLVDHVMRGAWAPIPVVGDAANALANVAEGKPLHYEASPAARAVEATGSALTDTLRVAQHAMGLNLDKDVSSKALEHWIEAPGYFLGLPTGQIARTVQNVADVKTGKVQPTTPVDAARHVAYGTQPSF